MPESSSAHPVPQDLFATVEPSRGVSSTAIGGGEPDTGDAVEEETSVTGGGPGFSVLPQPTPAAPIPTNNAASRTCRMRSLLSVPVAGPRHSIQPSSAGNTASEIGKARIRG